MVKKNGNRAELEAKKGKAEEKDAMIRKRVRGDRHETVEKNRNAVSYYRRWINLLTSFRATTGHHADSPAGCYSSRGTSINRTL